MRAGLSPVLVLGTLLALNLVVPPAPARAATIIVTTGADSGPGSLRQAIADAGSGDTITFAPEVTTVTVTSDQLMIATDLTIDGGTGVIIARSPAENTPTFRIFQITEGAVTFDSLTLRNGQVIDDSSGGGIANAGTLTVINSTITGNTTASYGGGIDNFNSTLTMINSTITGNTAGTLSGGIDNSYGTLTVINSTITGNTAGTLSGGIDNFYGTLTVINSTITDNATTSGAGGGIVNDTALLTLANTIVANNTGGDVVNDGTIMARGTNIIETPIAGEGTITGADTIIAGDPLLGPLADHGGPTQTHLPQPDSPAIDAGDPRVLSETFLAVDLTGDGDTEDTLTRDQRGFARITGDSVDIGAVEVGASPTAIGITAAPTQIAEAPDDDPTTTLISITRLGDLSTAGSVDIALGGTATVGDDYTLTFDETSGAAFADTTLTFNPGTTTATFTLTVIDDDTVEPDETVLITLSNGTAPDPVTLDPAGTTLTIIDDDQPVSGGDISVIYLPFVVR